MLFGQRVTADMFSVPGIRPLRGRAFTEQEDRDDARFVMLGYGLWKRRFGADPRWWEKQSR